MRSRRLMMPRLLLVTALVPLASCGGCGAAQGTVVDPRGPGGEPLRLLTVSSEVARGLSGATVDDEGALWMVPEEKRVLVRLAPSDGTIRTVPLRGVAEHLDTESIAWLGDGRFAIGTESEDDDRQRDPILFVRLAGGEAEVERAVECPYSLWSIEAEANEGLEALCAAGDALLVAVEVVGEDESREDRRYAPLARYDLGTGKWQAHRLWLTSDAGKISALACREGGEGMQVLAIERHFDVSRLLRFGLPAAAAARDVTPETVLDLARASRSSANFEGLGWLPSGEVAAVQDNHYGSQTTESSAVLFVPPSLLGEVP